jgi:hypothetical protein
MELLADRDPEEARKLLDPILEHMLILAGAGGGGREEAAVSSRRKPTTQAKTKAELIVEHAQRSTHSQEGSRDE